MAGLRSSKRNTPRKRYTIDAFEGIEALASESDSSDEETADAPEEDGADDFQAGAEPSEDEDYDPMSGGELDHVSDKASNAGERALDDDISIASDPEAPVHQRVPKRTRTDLPEALRLYTRGTPDNIHHRLTKKERRKYYFGSGDHDMDTLMKARARWGTEACFPSRRANKYGVGGFAYSVAHTKANSESGMNWNWYSSQGGQKQFHQRQQISDMTMEDARDYMTVDHPDERSFVMGAVDHQKLYTLPPRTSLPLHEPFEVDPEPGKHWKEVRPPEYKSGFVLNLGARVHSIDWAPSQSGNKQYLALAVLPTRPAEGDHEAPAFTPHPQHPSSIQIWELTAGSRGHVYKNIPPRLALVLCADMGDVKALKWCTAPQGDSSALGLLACISYDGSVRVIDMPEPPRTETAYHLIDTFAFESKPPDTVCTCLTWIDSQRLAVGCANGCVAIWDLAECLTNVALNPRPISYAGISTSYILTIASAWPTVPNILMVTSVTGHSTIIDISRPISDPGASASASRVRIGYSTLAWLEHGKSALAVEDNLTFKALPLRRWFNSIGLGKIKSSPTCIATSPCHPFVLLGSAGGEVYGNNPLRRIVDGGKVTIWQQEWFRHEWRRPSDSEVKEANLSNREGSTAAQNATHSDGATQMQDHTDDQKANFGKTGLSRFVEGFKAEKIILDWRSSVDFKKGVLLKTIYEEKTAITALAWNPNLHVGGWAAAGMADGLLRIEDVAA